MPTQATDGVTAESTTMAQTLPLPEVLQGGLGHTLLQMGGAVVLVVALILVLQKLANRYHPRWGGKSRGGGIEIVTQRALGNRLSLLVVETHGQTLLLGTSPQGVTSLANLGSGSQDGAARRWHEESAPGVPFVPEPFRSPEENPGRGTAVGNDRGSVPKTTSTLRDSGRSARGVIRSIAARAVARRPDNVPRSALADLEEASRIAREARERDERLTEQGIGGEVDLQEFEAQFRDKLRAIREKYPTLDEEEGRRA